MSVPDTDHRRKRGSAGAVLALATTTFALASTSAPAASPEASISATLSPPELTIGRAVQISGRFLEAGVGAAGAALALQIESYPFESFSTIARTVSRPDGSFAFTTARPDRNSRIRVVLERVPTIVGPELTVTVDPSVATNARSLGPGRTLLSIRMRHTIHAGSPSASVSWFVAARGTRVFHLAGVTPTRELERGLSYATLVVDPPSRRFAYRVCVNPAWERAMGSRGSHGRCPTHDFAVGHNVG